MTLLTLDRGNSTLDCLLWRGAEVLRRQRMDPVEPQGLPAFLGQERPSQVLASCVVPGGLQVAESVLAQLGLPVLLAGRDLACPLSLSYADAASLGTDRWLAALAAHRLYGAAVVVDCGTALTVNLVQADGLFLGGAIALGCSSMAWAMQQQTPALPKVDFQTPLPALAQSPQDAVNLGLTQGFVGMLEGLVQNLAAAASMQQAVRVITGGDASHYLAHGKMQFKHHPQLVHEGLQCLVTTPPSTS